MSEWASCVSNILFVFTLSCQQDLSWSMLQIPEKQKPLRYSEEHNRTMDTYKWCSCKIILVLIINQYILWLFLHILTEYNQWEWCNGNALGLFQGGARIEFRLGQGDPDFMLFLLSYNTSRISQNSTLVRPSPITSKSRDSVAGIATGYELDDWGAGLRVQIKNFLFSASSEPVWGPLSFLSNGYRGLFCRG
jgi:hypothetical protein